MTQSNVSKFTPLVSINAFTEHGLKKTWIKDESMNPSGTVKDRRNKIIIEEATHCGVDKLVLITAGSNGYSLAKLAIEKNIKVVCVVDRTLHKKIIEALKNVSHMVIEINLAEKTYMPAEIISLARESETETIWDVTNGYEDAYIPVFNEIFVELQNVDYIVVPLGSGGIYIGAIHAVERLGQKTKIIGIGPQTTYRSIANKLSTPWTPYSHQIENYSILGHSVIRLSEQEIEQAFEKYKNLVTTEASSTVVFTAPEKIPFKKDDCVVFLNSGKSIN